MNLSKCFLAYRENFCPYEQALRLNSHLGKKNEIFLAARKSVLKLVKLPSMVAKYCKYGKYTLARFANFVYICITHGKALPKNGRNSPEVVRLFRA